MMNSPAISRRFLRLRAWNASAISLCVVLCMFSFSCDLFGTSETSGTVIESVSAPFSIDENTIFISTTNRLNGQQDFTYAVDIQNRSIVSTISYKNGKNLWGPERVVPSADRLWILGANMQNHRTEVFVINPQTGSLEETLKYEMDNPADMYYLPSIKKVVVTHGSYYPNRGSPISVFDTASPRFEGTLWNQNSLSQFREDSAGTIWGTMRGTNMNWFGIFSFGNGKVEFEKRYDIDSTFSVNYCVPGWPFTILPDGTIACGNYSENGLQFYYPDGSKSLASMGDDLNNSRPISGVFFCPISNKIFVSPSHIVPNAISMLEKNPTTNVWGWSPRTIPIEGLGGEFMVQNGILVDVIIYESDRRRYRADFYSTTSLASGSLDKLGTLELQ